LSAPADESLDRTSRALRFGIAGIKHYRAVLIRITDKRNRHPLAVTDSILPAFS